MEQLEKYRKLVEAQGLVIAGVLVSLLGTGLVMWAEKGGPWMNLGFALITSGLVAILFRFFLQASFLYKLREELNQLAPALDVGRIELSNRMHEAGLVAVHPCLNLSPRKRHPKNGLWKRFPPSPFGLRLPFQPMI